MYTASDLHCIYGYTCAVTTASGKKMAACCDENDTENCDWYSSCVNYESMTKGLCDASCRRNGYIKQCTDASAPYCVTWTYPAFGAVDFACTTDNWGVRSVYQDAVEKSSSLSSSYTAAATLLALSGDIGSTNPTESSSGRDSETTPRTESSKGTDGKPTHPTESSGGRNEEWAAKSKPIAAIIGSVVGACVFLLIISAIVIFCCIKRRKAKQLADNQRLIANVQKPDYHTDSQDYELEQPASTYAAKYAHSYHDAPRELPAHSQTTELPSSGLHEVGADLGTQTRPRNPQVFEMGTGR